MAGINYEKVGELAEAKGDYKRAADYFSHVDKDRAFSSYKKFLEYISNKPFITTEDRNAVGDITKRFSQLRAPQYLKRLLNDVKEEMKEKKLKPQYLKMLFNDINKGKRLGGTLEKRIFPATASVIFLAVSLFFVVFSFTGYSIYSLTGSDYAWMGLGLFLCGLIFAFIYLRKK